VKPNMTTEETKRYLERYGIRSDGDGLFDDLLNMDGGCSLTEGAALCLARYRERQELVALYASPHDAPFEHMQAAITSITEPEE